MSVEVTNETVWQIDGKVFSDLGIWVMDQMRVSTQSDLTIMFVDPDPIAQLHMRWMNLEGPTDVMSFPMDELRPAGACSRTQHHGGNDASDDPRHSPPAWIRSRDTGTGAPDVRPAASTAANLLCSPPRIGSAGDSSVRSAGCACRMGSGAWYRAADRQIVMTLPVAYRPA